MRQRRRGEAGSNFLVDPEPDDFFSSTPAASSICLFLVDSRANPVARWCGLSSSSVHDGRFGWCRYGVGQFPFENVLPSTVTFARRMSTLASKNAGRRYFPICGPASSLEGPFFHLRWCGVSGCR